MYKNKYSDKWMKYRHRIVLCTADTNQDVQDRCVDNNLMLLHKPYGTNYLRKLFFITVEY